MNPPKTNPVHFLQIWLMPDQRGIKPSYEEKRFDATDKQGRLRLVASRDARDGAVAINQDVDLYAGVFKNGDGTRFELRPGRHAWLQVARGAVTLNGETLNQGDGAAVSDETALALTATEDAEVLVFDLA
jgi:redox-sensitive bicupin YhaK (pirin superfamily)